MNTGRDDFSWQNRREGSRSGLYDPDEDHGYWESLLQEGEVTSSDDPPPWIGEDFNSASHRNGDGYDPVASEEEDWGLANRYLDEAKCCDLTVSGYNRGGLLVQFGNITGFVPCSHLADFSSSPSWRHREDLLASRVGEELRLQVIEIDRSRNRLILSERAVHGDKAEQILASLTPGDVVAGRVSNLRRFGVFVDLGGFEGLVHISELSWGRVNRPDDLVQPGDRLEVYVMEINQPERKVQLSLKRLQPDPWQEVRNHYSVGQLVEGQITNVVSFGAFVRLEEGVEGLIHISELAEGNFLHPRNVVREGDWVAVRVLNINPAGRRIGLSLRQARQADLTPPDSPQQQLEKASLAAW